MSQLLRLGIDPAIGGSLDSTSERAAPVMIESMANVGGWIWEDALEKALLAMSSYIGYRFDESDWQAISQAVADTDDQVATKWYSFPLVGEVEVQVQMARSIGDGIVMINVVGDLDEVTVARFEVVLDLL